MNKENNINQTPEEKPFYKTKKGIIAIIGACCVGILVLGGIVSLLAPDYISQNESEGATDYSMTPEEAFIEEYDTNGDLLLDSDEFPLVKVVEIDSREQIHRTTYSIIKDYDIDQNGGLSAYELKNIENLNL